MKILLSAARALLLLSILFSPQWLSAQASVNVSPLDPVYRDIDKLVAHGLIDVIITGQKPYSRKEIGRLIAAAMKNRSRISDQLDDPNLDAKKREKIERRLDFIDGILNRLKPQYREELVQIGAVAGEKRSYSLHPIAQADVDVTITNSPAEALPLETGPGKIDAVINPLVDYRQGRHLIDGANLSLETTHWLRASDHFALFFRPRFQVAIGRDETPDDNRVDILGLNGKFYIKNFELAIGRDYLFYGQGNHAGLLLSDNPRGLDMAKISNDSPFFFPWVFRYMGANKMSFFYADLGPEQNFPNAYLAGYKWSLQPLSWFELGASIMVQSGGDGSPPASFGERVGDLFPVGPGSSLQISNRFGGFDGRFRIPPLRGTEIYFEAILDDKGKFNYRTWWQDAGYIFGLYVPRLTHTGSLDLRLEYHHTGIRYYRHAQFTSGWTENQFILGDNLGPDAYGFYGDINWDVDGQNRLGFHGAFEHRSSDFWAINGTVSPDGEFSFVGDFFKTQDNPDETRIRMVADWLYRFPDDVFYLTVEAGYEHVDNFQFTAGNDRNNFLGRVAFQINLDRWTGFPKPR